MSFLTEIKEEICEHPPKNSCCRRNLVQEQFCRQAEKLPQKHGGRLHALSFQSFSATKFLQECDVRFLNNPLPKQCPECQKSFLRGLFLAAGHITDPEKAYHLELSLGSRAEMFIPFLNREYDLYPKLARRRDETLLYWKESSTLEDIMAMLGINDAAFRFMNCKIEKQFRNEANRRTNCEAGNINRSVEAASRLLGLLATLEEKFSLSVL
ncbi:MAG: DNA-binding protein WhiA, partial [Clostridia bacterium]|nr:DNA-binding protein WhiA [Clostridia bacterium]